MVITSSHNRAVSRYQLLNVTVHVDIDAQLASSQQQRASQALVAKCSAAGIELDLAPDRVRVEVEPHTLIGSILRMKGFVLHEMLVLFIIPK